MFHRCVGFALCWLVCRRDDAAGVYVFLASDPGTAPLGVLKTDQLQAINRNVQS